jgi:FkbM family methyltransferase
MAAPNRPSDPPLAALRVALARRLGRGLPPMPGLTRLLRALVPPGRMSRPVAVAFDGGIWRGDLANLMDWWIDLCGAYEPANLALLASLAHEAATRRGGPVTFLDVGANAGQHTLFMSRRVAHVVAVEPLPRFAERLERTLAENGRDNVRLLRCGFGAVSADLPYVEDTGTVATGTFHTATATVGRAQRHTLPVRPGDAALAEIGAGRIDVAKIDTDGFEAEALAGLAQTLARDRPAILMEYSEATRAKLPDRAALLAAVPRDYVLHELRASRWGARPRPTPAPPRPGAPDLLLRPADWPA